MEMWKFVFGEVIVPTPAVFSVFQDTLNGIELSEVEFARELDMMVHPPPSLVMSQRTLNPAAHQTPSGSIQ